MRAYDLIYKKREGASLSAEEIEFLIKGYTEGDIPDYQMSAWAMAVYFQGMSAEETAVVTRVMAESGDMIDLSAIEGFKVDKHSTGGVGDTTTLVLAPLVSSTGIPVAKMSGKGLGHTGGTIDKLESIPGFSTELEIEQFIDNVNKIGIAVAGQTGNLTPADKKLYGLRDVTATVDSIPLIASSIMSKKIAGGADGIVLDVKTGNGAFMKSTEESRKLAATMVDIGSKIGRKTRAVITDMNQPLGLAVGNSLEVKEALATLKGRGPGDLEELCLTLGANMLLIAGRIDNFDNGYQILKNKLTSGEALNQMEKFIDKQGGNKKVIYDESLLPQARYQKEVISSKQGYIKNINTQEIGLITMMIGGGRQQKDDVIDPAVGIILKKKHGDRVDKGEPLAVLHINDKSILKEAEQRLQNAYSICVNRPKPLRLIHEMID